MVVFLGYMIFWFFRGCDGIRGKEREKRKKEKEKQKQTQNHTEPRYITSHTTHTHLPFLPLSVVFLMIPDNLYVHMYMYKCL